MRTDHPLTLTVEQAAEVLGVGRSTAYELVRSGDIASVRLRRRIVVPVAQVADQLGVSIGEIWSLLDRRLSSRVDGHGVRSCLRPLEERGQLEVLTHPGPPTLFDEP